ncbi:MAG: hypothetical protein ACJA2S_004247, partial [Cyclobacteriaceae bacterium]
MIPQKSTSNQLNFLSPSLKEQLNDKQSLYLLSDTINW